MGSNPTVTNTNELIILYKFYGTSKWFRVDGYVDRNNAPQGDDPPSSKLYDFTLTLKDPKDSDGNPFTRYMLNGDDIAVVETLEYLTILDDIKCGTIVKTQILPKGMKDGRWIREFKLTIENRDFSIKPFKMGLSSFPNQSISQDLVDVLDVIFGFDPITSEPTTRNDLGGILANGTIISKYVLLSDTTDVGVIETQFGARETLDQYMTTINYKWRPIAYPNATGDDNLINPIYQIQIWQDS